MDKEPLFTLEGPICALDLGAGRTSTLCPRCLRAKSTQTGELAVELVCKTNGVVASSASSILLEASIANEIETRSEWSLHSGGVRVSWREGINIDEAVPELRQLVADRSIHASSGSVEFEDCDCRSVRQIEFNPLIVRPPEIPKAGVWFLSENPRVLIIGERLQKLLLGWEPSLEFKQVYYEGEYSPPTSTFAGQSWSDL